MRKRWMLMILLVPIVAFAIVYVVTTLWNCLIPVLFNGPAITYLQALGLLILSKIFFGGVGGRKWGCGCHCGEGGYWKNKMHSRMEGMTPEEKEKFKQAFKNRCGWEE